MTPQVCDTCRYSQPRAVDDGLVLECHRYPPQMANDPEDLVVGWPQLPPDGWCGEWQQPTGEPPT